MLLIPQKQLFLLCLQVQLVVKMKVMLIGSMKCASLLPREEGDICNQHKMRYLIPMNGLIFIMAQPHPDQGQGALTKHLWRDLCQPFWLPVETEGWLLSRQRRWFVMLRRIEKDVESDK